MKWIALVATVVVAGCAHHGGAADAGSPSELAVAPDATYSLPSGGTVRFAVGGLRQVPATRLGQNGFRALVVRMTLDNGGGSEPWRVAPREQVARIDTYGPLLPANVRVPTLAIAPGQATTLELLYPIPVPAYGPEMPRNIALEWRVHVADGVIKERAVLDRQLARVMREQL
jgi:hypothetical protein